MISLKRMLISLFALLCVGASLEAQLNRGSVTGTVTDPTGAVIPRVNILIQNTATSATYERMANTRYPTCQLAPIKSLSRLPVLRSWCAAISNWG